MSTSTIHERFEIIQKLSSPSATYIFASSNNDFLAQLSRQTTVLKQLKRLTYRISM